MKKKSYSDDVLEDMPEVARFNDSIEKVNNSLTLLNGLSFSTENIVNKISDTMLEIAKLDYQLDCVLATIDMKLEKFKTIAPMMERQLNNISNRIDKLTDIIVEKNKNILTESELKQQSILLDALTQANDSFNNMIMKMMVI